MRVGSAGELYGSFLTSGGDGQCGLFYYFRYGAPIQLWAVTVE